MKTAVGFRTVDTDDDAAGSVEGSVLVCRQWIFLSA